MNPTYFALIPAYEPDEHLPALIEEAVQAGFHIIVVNDGSSDRCSAVFAQAEYFATVLVHAENRGKGSALKTGFSYIQTICESEDIVVTLDADGQHTIPDALTVCHEAEQHPDALILGSRDFTGHVPLKSRFGNSVTRLVYRLASGAAVRDTQTGLRACSCKLLPLLCDITGDRYEYEMNVLMTCPKRNIPIREVPIETIYIAGNRSSHFHAIRDSYRIYKEIFRFSASSFISFLIDYALFSLLSAVTVGPGSMYLVFSNVTARIISASVNYTINRKLVFHHTGAVRKSITGYILLASGILIGNTCLLSIFVNVFGMNRMPAKLLTELVFFLISYLIQRRIIFNSRSKNKRKDSVPSSVRLPYREAAR